MCSEVNPMSEKFFEGLFGIAESSTDLDGGLLLMKTPNAPSASALIPVARLVDGIELSGIQEHITIMVAHVE